MFYSVRNIDINIGGGSFFPCWNSFGCFPMSYIMPRIYTPMNFFAFNAGANVGSYVGNRVMSYLC